MHARLQVFAFAILLTSGLLARGQEPTKIGRENRDERSIRETVDAIADATDHNDANALDNLWAADYIFVNPFGIVMTKAQRLNLFRSGQMRLESYSRDQETIRVYGTTAVVIYRSTVRGLLQGQKGTQDLNSQRRVTTVLLKRRGRWQAVSQQSTIIAATQ